MSRGKTLVELINEHGRACRAAGIAAARVHDLPKDASDEARAVAWKRSSWLDRAAGAAARRIAKRLGCKP